MPRVKDLTGKKFTRLTVIKQIGINKRNRALWLCRCDCGNEKILVGHDIKNGRTKSCGCLGVEVRKSNMEKGRKNKIKKTDMKKEKSNRTIRTKGGGRIARIYNHMFNRCYNFKNDRYKDYGGRGIQICEEWKNDYLKFKEWSLNNGYKEYLTIDRIDVNGNYEPSNCRWATSKEQASNKRSNHYLVINGVKKTITEWSKEYKIKLCTVTTRIKRGMNEIEALTTPLKKRVNKNG